MLVSATSGEVRRDQEPSCCSHWIPVAASYLRLERRMSRALRPAKGDVVLPYDYKNAVNLILAVGILPTVSEPLIWCCPSLLEAFLTRLREFLSLCSDFHSDLLLLLPWRVSAVRTPQYPLTALSLHQGAHHSEPMSLSGTGIEGSS